MPVYATREQLHAVAGRLFERLQEENARAAEQMLRSRLLIRLRCYHPTAEIWINGRRRPLSTHFGHQRLHPDLDIALETDTLHDILLGQLSLTKALGNGRLEVRGPLWKAKALADLFRQGQSLYAQVMRECGVTG